MINRKFGWIRDLGDTRDLIMPLQKGNLHKEVDLRPGCSPVEDQENYGSCVANALAGALEFLEIKDGKPFVNFSRLFLYYNAREHDGDVPCDYGTQIRVAVKLLKSQGICDEKLWDYTKKFDRKPNKKAYVDAQKHVITSYHRVQSLNGILSSLSEGYPVVFGFVVFESFADAAKNGIMHMPLLEIGDAPVGGHAIMACGYNMKKKILIVRNSWGPKWGDKGYFYMPFDYITTEFPALADDFWVIKSGTGM